MYNKTIKSALVFMLLLIGGSAQATPSSPSHARELLSPVVFQNSVRILWEDHVAWTRAWLISASNDLKDKNIVWQRLVKNQEDIGNSIKPFYGDEAAATLTSLLKDHIKIAGDLVGFLLDNKDTEATNTMTLWQTNANDISVFLNKANPTYWPLADLQAMLSAHLESTTTEVKAELAEDYAGSIAAFDMVRDQMLKMADFLSLGIIKQFPDKFMQCFR